ncbi:MAG: metal-dependent transcriptional regulator [Kiritimatiellae bacterium]|nr:metal-dependent transcriptional regulator [Kiritimatiellia bacterium]
MTQTRVKQNVTATMEDYLEAILHISEQSGQARSRDIAEQLGVHRSTVTSALRGLAEKRLINYAPYRAATLTRKGRQIAERIGRSHEQIETFLRDVLLVPKRAARENACRMEHVVDRNVIQRLVKLGQHLRSRPRRSRATLAKAISSTTKETPSL